MVLLFSGVCLGFVFLLGWCCRFTCVWRGLGCDWGFVGFVLVLFFSFGWGLLWFLFVMSVCLLLLFYMVVGMGFLFGGFSVWVWGFVGFFLGVAFLSLFFVWVVLFVLVWSFWLFSCGLGLCVASCVCVGGVGFVGFVGFACLC